jgi:hypothetical protein
MTKRRRETREREIGASFSEHVLRSAEQQSWSKKGDEDLFFIDRGSTGTMKQNTERDLSVKKAGLISKTEIRLVEKSLSRRSPATRSQHKGSETDALTDLWSNEVNLIPYSRKQKDFVKEKAKVKIIPGLSYNPSLTDHQDLLAEVSYFAVLYFVKNTSISTYYFEN